MTWRCYVCGINWYPFMTIKGACPKCGEGTKAVQQPTSPNAVTEHARLCAIRDKADSHDRFNNFYIARDVAGIDKEWDDL